MPVQTTEENKIVHHNRHATIVIKNGATEVIKVERPAEGDQKGRDIQFNGLVELQDFLADVKDVYIAACKTMGVTPNLLGFQEPEKKAKR